MDTAPEIEAAAKWNHNGSTEEVPAMPVTITLKNIPDALYESLKASAARNRRSLNSEVIARLEESTGSWSHLSVEERLERIRAARVTLRGGPFDPEELERYINEGRP